MMPGLRPCMLLGLTAVLVGCENGPATTPSMGTLERDRIELAADSNEPIVELLVDEGDRVAAGDPLLRPDPARVSAQLERARAEFRQAAARLDEADAGPRAETIDQARSRLQAARSSERTAKLELDRSRELLKQALIPDNTVDVQAGRYDEAVARRKEAEEVLQELLEGTRSEQIDQARSAVDAAQANIETLELSLDRTTIRAPTAGVVEALPYEPGERPPQGATVVAMLADGRTYGRVYIPQPERNRLGPGARAEIRIDGYPQPFAGELHWVAADPAFTPFFALTRFDRSRLSYLAEVDLLDPVAADLPAGLAVEVYFPDL